MRVAETVVRNLYKQQTIIYSCVPFSDFILDHQTGPRIGTSRVTQNALCGDIDIANCDISITELCHYSPRYVPGGQSCL